MARKPQTIKFKPDTAERKQFFNAASFGHPAKMIMGLQVYLIENFTKIGETILDPMAGSGTALIACTIGRNVILVELEKKFVKMQKDNWKKIKRLGPMLGFTLGKATIIQGDARNLEGIFAEAIVFSPPYAEAQCGDKRKSINKTIQATVNGKQRGVSLEKYYHENSEGNIGNLPYGQIDAVKADAVITSPPYEDQLPAQDRKWLEEHKHTITSGGKAGVEFGPAMNPQNYTKENIGNLKSDNYLQAMLQVYQQCRKVLKDKGLMVLVTKNFIRDKKIVRLDLDTIKLCEQAGFRLKERLKRKLTQQSFWRTISLMKCDHRKGNSEEPKCDLGLECPAELTDEQLWDLLRYRKDSIKYAKKIKKRMEKKCPQFVNTMPKIEHEDILVFEKFGDEQ